MSKESEYRERAVQARILADTIANYVGRESLRRVEVCWLLLAYLEAKREQPTQWDQPSPLRDPSA